MEIEKAIAAFREFEKKTGPKTEVHVSLNVRRAWATNLHASVYLDGMGYGMDHSEKADSFEDLLIKLETWWAENSAALKAATIRKMALRIIDLSEDGSCSDRALRLNGNFSDHDIVNYATDACVLAAELAAKGPFSIEFTQAANAA